MLEPSYSAWEDYVKLWKTGSTKNFGRESPDKFLQFPPTIPVYPHLLGGAHMPFCPPVEAMHAVTIMSLKAIGLQIIICRHCVDQQTDSLVFTEFHSDHREWSHWKVGEQRPTLAPLHRNLEGHLPSLPYSLFWPLYVYKIVFKFKCIHGCWLKQLVPPSLNTILLRLYT